MCERVNRAWSYCFQVIQLVVHSIHIQREVIIQTFRLKGSHLVELLLTFRTVSIALVASHKISERLNGRHGLNKLLIYIYNILYCLIR